MRGKLPDVGQEIVTKMGNGRIVGRNVIKETLIVELETRVRIEVPNAEAVIINPRKP
jgi:hypothetical protein